MMFSLLTIFFLHSITTLVYFPSGIHQYSPIFTNMSSVECLEFLPQLRPDIFNQLIRIRYLDYSRRRKVIAGSLQEVSERLVGVVVVVGVLLWSVCGGMVVVEWLSQLYSGWWYKYQWQFFGYFGSQGVLIICGDELLQQIL